MSIFNNNTKLANTIRSSLPMEVVAGLAVICRAAEDATFEETVKRLVIDWTGRVAWGTRGSKSEAAKIILKYVEEAFKMSSQTAARYVEVAFGAIREAGTALTPDNYWKGVRAIGAALETSPDNIPEA